MWFPLFIFIRSLLAAAFADIHCFWCIVVAAAATAAVIVVVVVVSQSYSFLRYSDVLSLFFSTCIRAYVCERFFVHFIRILSQIHLHKICECIRPPMWLLIPNSYCFNVWYSECFRHTISTRYSVFMHVCDGVVLCVWFNFLCRSMRFTPDFTFTELQKYRCDCIVLYTKYMKNTELNELS